MRQRRSLYSQRYSVLYVEDHTLVREAISRFIDLQPDMKVVASAATGEEGVHLYDRHHPDVTLMDLQLPRMSGLQAIEAIRDRDAEARVVVLTMYSQGMRNKEIAASLGISKETADAHLKHILAKLGVNDRTAAVNIALRRGIIHIS
jgi:DNA-binding NarL/FixJ family response regulator